jgi:hypothetical protein
MSDDHTRSGLSEDELAQQRASDLPDREAMSVLDGLPSLDDLNLLNLDVNLDAAVHGAAPINAAVAANANVAAPVDASVGANVLSVDSTAVANSPQQTTITQTLDGVAQATADQGSSIDQGTGS